MERETGFDPATLALARRCSTTELFPPEGASQDKKGLESRRFIQYRRPPRRVKPFLGFWALSPRPDRHRPGRIPAPPPRGLAGEPPPAGWPRPPRKAWRPRPARNKPLRAERPAGRLARSRRPSPSPPRRRT